MGLHPNKPTVTWKITNQNVFNTPPQTCWEHLHLGSDPEFRLNSNRHPLLLTRSRRRKWAFCRRDGMWKHRTQYPKNAGNIVEYQLYGLWKCINFAPIIKSNSLRSNQCKSGINGIFGAYLKYGRESRGWRKQQSKNFINWTYEVGCLKANTV